MCILVKKTMMWYTTIFVMKNDNIFHSSILYILFLSYFSYFFQTEYFYVGCIV